MTGSHHRNRVMWGKSDGVRGCDFSWDDQGEPLREGDVWVETWMMRERKLCGHVKAGCPKQRVYIACAKIPRQDGAWYVAGTVKRSLWSEWGGEKEEGRAGREQDRSCRVLWALGRTWAFTPGRWEPRRAVGRVERMWFRCSQVPSGCYMEDRP